MLLTIPEQISCFGVRGELRVAVDDTTLFSFYAKASASKCGVSFDDCGPSSAFIGCFFDNVAERSDAARFGRNTVFVVPSESVHLKTPAERENAFLACFPTESFTADILLNASVNEGTCRFKHGGASAFVASLFRVLFANADRLDGEDFSCALYSLLLCIYLLLDTSFEREAGGGDGALIARTRRHIERRYAHYDLGLDNVARSLDCSRSTLFRALKRNELSLTQMIHDVRMSHAACMLASCRNVQDVVAKVGYLDHSAFCKAFRRYAGMTPTEYRRVAEEKERREHDLLPPE